MNKIALLIIVLFLSFSTLAQVYVGPGIRSLPFMKHHCPPRGTYKTYWDPVTNSLVLGHTTVEPAEFLDLPCCFKHKLAQCGCHHHCYRY